MYKIFDFETESSEKITNDFNKIRSRFNRTTSTNTKPALEVPTYWDRQSVEKHNKGLCDELLNMMW